MGKIYEVELVSERIDMIVFDSGKINKITYKEIFTSHKYRYATFIGCSLAALQLLSGVNCVMLYSGKIFEQVKWNSKIGSAVTGITNWISSFGGLYLLGSKLSFLLKLLEFGRRQILWFFSFLMMIDLVGLGVAYFYVNDSDAAKIICIVLILAFVIFFAISQGPVIWLYLAEILNDK